MMALLSFLFEGALAALMIVLIAYCVKLNRGLAAVRANDTQINELIARLVEASDRAEAAVAQLKAVGVAQERALRAAIDDAETARTRLARAGRTEPRAAAPPPASRGRDAGDAPLPAGALASLESLVGLPDNSRSPAVPGERTDAGDGARDDARDTRRETEQTLLAAIRQARAAG